MQEDGLLLQRVAAVAHDCWRARRREEGWSLGPGYDPNAKLHDALRSFDDLPERDQKMALMSVRVEQIMSTLASAIDYPRGPDRPFYLDEMQEGRPVALAPRDPSGPRRLGAIVGWEVVDGELAVIRVRWEDGGVDDFDPWLQALARPEELPGLAGS